MGTLTQHFEHPTGSTAVQMDVLLPKQIVGQVTAVARDGLAQKSGPGLWDGEAFYETAGIARV